jgi:hypothetical protein
MRIEEERHIYAIVDNSGREDVNPKSVQNGDYHPDDYSFSFEQKFVQPFVVEHTTAIQAKNDTQKRAGCPGTCKLVFRFGRKFCGILVVV